MWSPVCGRTVWYTCAGRVASVLVAGVGVTCLPLTYVGVGLRGCVDPLLLIADRRSHDRRFLHGSLSRARLAQVLVCVRSAAVTELGVAPPSGEEIGGRKPRMEETNFEEFLSFQSAVPAGCAARTRRCLR